MLIRLTRTVDPMVLKTRVLLSINVYSRVDKVNWKIILIGLLVGNPVAILSHARLVRDSLYNIKPTPNLTQLAK